MLGLGHGHLVHATAAKHGSGHTVHGGTMLQQCKNNEECSAAVKYRGILRRALVSVCVLRSPRFEAPSSIRPLRVGIGIKVYEARLHGQLHGFRS